jgi:hypothetical protein
MEFLKSSKKLFAMGMSCPDLLGNGLEKCCFRFRQPGF